MELSRGKLLIWFSAALVIGVWVGFGAFTFIVRDAQGTSYAAFQERSLQDNVVVLKMLDEGKTDLAKKFLETYIQVALDGSTETLKLSMNQGIRELYVQKLRFASLAMKDRSKTYLQLLDETRK